MDTGHFRMGNGKHVATVQGAVAIRLCEDLGDQALNSKQSAKSRTTGRQSGCVYLASGVQIFPQVVILSFII